MLFENTSHFKQLIFRINFKEIELMILNCITLNLSIFLLAIGLLMFMSFQISCILILHFDISAS
jgi:hypothetical protein